MVEGHCKACFFPAKGKTGNILGFVGLQVSAESTQLGHPSHHSSQGVIPTADTGLCFSPWLLDGRAAWVWGIRENGSAEKGKGGCSAAGREQRGQRHFSGLTQAPGFLLPPATGLS